MSERIAFSPKFRRNAVISTIFTRHYTLRKTSSTEIPFKSQKEHTALGFSEAEYDRDFIFSSSTEHILGVW
jgi:hypothetical protein